jgi:hypothetical protein
MLSSRRSIVLRLLLNIGQFVSRMRDLLDADHSPPPDHLRHPRVYQKISFRWIAGSSQVKPGNDGM